MVGSILIAPTTRSLLAGASYALRILEELEIRCHPENRLARARRYVLGAVDEAEGLGSTSVDADRFCEALRTMLEQYLIVRSLVHPGKELKSKVALMLDGADVPSEDRRTAGRDTQFELLAGALLSLSGVQGISLGEPDLRIRAGSEDIGIAVKRISGSISPARKVKAAIKQMRASRVRGIVVLGVDPFVSVSADPDDLHNRVDEATVECGRLIVKREAQDALFGVWSVATGYEILKVESGLPFQLHMSQSFHLLAEPEEHPPLLRRMNVIARNLIQGVNREMSILSALG